MKSLQPLGIGDGSAVLEVMDDLRQALDGEGPALLPIPAAGGAQARLLRDTMAIDEPIDDNVALVVATSGSTGIPKGAMLSAQALRSSVDATHAYLGGTGSWLLALPAYHIAGLQVLLRSLTSGGLPVVMDVSAGFDPDSLPAAVASMRGARRYTALIPGQLRKALTSAAATSALSDLDAVLIGGAALATPVLDMAQAAGINVIRTYGMSETCGGCVYDGLPLPGVQITIEQDTQRILLAGPMLANGYRNFPDHDAFAQSGRFRTDDIGSIAEGVLRVHGRADDAITTGGLTIAPLAVEQCLLELPSVRECVVLGVSDEQLGDQVAALVVANALVTVDELRAHVAGRLVPHAAPRRVLFADALPTLPSGKVDRNAVRRQFGG